jgi:hypothetical protein
MGKKADQINFDVHACALSTPVEGIVVQCAECIGYMPNYAIVCVCVCVCVCARAHATMPYR